MKRKLIVLGLMAGLSPLVLSTPILANNQNKLTEEEQIELEKAIAKAKEKCASETAFYRGLTLRRSNRISNKGAGTSEGANLSYDRDMKANSFTFATDFSLEWNSAELVNGHSEKAGETFRFSEPTINFLRALPTFAKVSNGGGTGNTRVINFLSKGGESDVQSTRFIQPTLYGSQALPFGQGYLNLDLSTNSNSFNSDINAISNAIKLFAPDDFEIQQVILDELLAGYRLDKDTSLRYLETKCVVSIEGANATAVVTREEVDSNFGITIEGIFNDSDSTEGAGQFSVGIAARGLQSIEYGGITSNIKDLNLKWETDQDFDTANLVISYNLTPTTDDTTAGAGAGIASVNASNNKNTKRFGLNMISRWDQDADDGELKKDGLDKDFRFRPALDVSIDAVTNVQQGTSNQQSTTAIRIPVIAKLEFFFPSLNKYFAPHIFKDDKFDEHGKGTKLFVKNTFHYTPDDQRDTTHNYFQAGFTVPVSEKIGAEVSFDSGQLAPNYNNVEKFRIGLNAKF